MSESNSIRVKVRRTTIEFASISVPDDESVWRTSEAGTRRVDVKKVFAAARLAANRSDVDWKVEADRSLTVTLAKPPSAQRWAGFQ